MIPAKIIKKTVEMTLSINWENIKEHTREERNELLVIVYQHSFSNYIERSQQLAEVKEEIWDVQNAIIEYNTVWSELNVEELCPITEPQSNPNLN